MVEKKNFGLINEKGEEIGVFEGAQPRDAALKAANRGIVDIILREKGTKRLHYFKGSRTLIPVPDKAPPHIKASAAKHNGKIHKANVEKIGVGHLEFTDLSRNPKDLFKLPAKAAA